MPPVAARGAVETAFSAGMETDDCNLHRRGRDLREDEPRDTILHAGRVVVDSRRETSTQGARPEGQPVRCVCIGLVAAAFGLAAVSGCGGGEGVDAPPPDFGSIVVTPRPAKAGDVVTITFTAIRELSAAPTVTVDGDAATYVSSVGLEYTYTYTVTGIESEGAVEILISGDDLDGNPLSSPAPFTLDFTAPAAAADPLTTSDTTPGLTGTVDDAAAAISVTVGGQTNPAVNNGDGTWTLLDGTLTALAEGTYDVQVAATDAAGNVGTDAGTSELTVDPTPPAGTVLAPGLPGGTTMPLTWSAATDGFTQQADLVYRVYYSTSDFADTAAAVLAFTSDPGATSGTVTGLSPVTDYHIALVAVDELGNEEALSVDNKKAVATGTALQLSWVKRAGGGSADECYDATVLPDGSVVVVGYFGGSATFGLGEPGAVTLASAGGKDVFLARYGPDGSFAWAKRAGGPGNDWCWRVKAFPDGSVLASGGFEGTAQFGPGEPGGVSLVCASAGEPDAFFGRYASDGTLVWARRAGGTHRDYGGDVAVLSEDAILITGEFSRTASFWPGEAGAVTFTTTNYWDIFILGCDANGELRWAERAGSPWHDYPDAVAAFSDGSAVVAGFWGWDGGGTLTLGGGARSFTSLGSNDIYVTRYGSTGSLLWAVHGGGTGVDYLWDADVSADDSVFVTGFFESTLTLGIGAPGSSVLVSGGSHDAYVARLSAGGAVGWVSSDGGPGYDRGYGVAALPDGMVATAGNFESTASFGADGPGGEDMLSAGGADLFVVLRRGDGSFVGAVRAGGTGYDSANTVSSLGEGAVVAAGCFEATATFGPGEANQDDVTSSGGRDIFVARFTP